LRNRPVSATQRAIERVTHGKTTDEATGETRSSQTRSIMRWASARLGPPPTPARRPDRPQAENQQGVTHVASNTSKTARASVRAGQATGGALSVLGEFKYVIPLNSGKHAYVRNLTNGKTVHLRTDSDAFVEEIRVLAGAGHGPKIRIELDALAAANPTHGWDATAKRLIDAGVFDLATA
jgi:hypothetical protein